MILRSGRILNMAGGSDDQKVTTVSHTVTNYKSGIEPFAGRINGELKQGVEVFIESIENHLASRNIDDEEEQFREARGHLNLSSGDLGDCTRSLFFRHCSTWSDLKEFLRATYGSCQQKDLVLDLRRVLKLHERGGNSFLAQNAKINDGIIDFCSNLKKSSWADADSRNAISIDNLSTLLQLSIGVLSLPDALVNNFDETFSPSSTERDVMSQINKHIGKLTVSDSTILGGSSRENKLVKVVEKPQDNSSRIDRNFQQQQHQQQQQQQRQGASGVMIPRRVVHCFNCDREGHVKKDCQVKYCGYHQSTTHNWRDCKVIRSNMQYRP